MCKHCSPQSVQYIKQNELNGFYNFNDLTGCETLSFAFGNDGKFYCEQLDINKFPPEYIDWFKKTPKIEITGQL